VPELTRFVGGQYDRVMSLDEPLILPSPVPLTDAEPPVLDSDRDLAFA
jgi:hypothetical protein